LGKTSSICESAIDWDLSWEKTFSDGNMTEITPKPRKPSHRIIIW